MLPPPPPAAPDNSQLGRLGYYPRTFEVDYEGKNKRYEGIVLLPFVRRAEVERIYRSVPLELYYARNRVDVQETFEVDPGFLADYSSDFGDLEGIRARKL